MPRSLVNLRIIIALTWAIQSIPICQSANAQGLNHSPFSETTPKAIRDFEKAAIGGWVEEATAFLTEHQDPKVAEAVLRLLAAKRLSESSRRGITSAVTQWPAGGPGKEYLAAALLKHTNPMGADPRLLRFYAALGLPKALPVFLRIIAPKKPNDITLYAEPERIVAALQGIVKFPEQPEAVVRQIGTYLSPDAPLMIRGNAAQTLSGMKSPIAVEALIGSVGDKDIEEDVLGALYRLTGHKFDTDAAQWKAWWDKEGKTAGLKMLPLEDMKGFLTARRLFPKEDPINAESFYGMAFNAKRALFVLDRSGSMSGSRMTKLQDQMAALLDQIQASGRAVHYAIITFDDTADSSLNKSALLDNNEADHKKATRFVRRMEADGGTAMNEALRHAEENFLSKHNLDTIFFLTDGDPSDGKPEDVLALALTLHETFRVKFNTIRIGGESAVAAPPGMGLQAAELLQRMASETGGTFVQVSEGP